MRVYGYPYRLLAVVILLLMTAANAPAQLLSSKPNQPQEEGIQILRLTVSPAAEPKPALKYRFLIPPVDQVPGNAATLYYKAMSFEGTDQIEALNKLDSDDEKHRIFYEAPLDEFPIQEAEQATHWLRVESGYGLWLRQAAKCENCNWEDMVREQGMYTLLPQIQNARGLARALVMRTRLQLAQQKPEEALETMGIAFALSRNLGKGTTLIHCLVGLAIEGLMEEQSRILICMENSPNLYWALTDLAANPVDFRKALSYESRFWEFTIHELPDLDRRTLSAEDALNIAVKMRTATAGMVISHPKHAEPRLQQAEILGLTVSLYPQAQRYLLNHGYGSERIDAMPVLQTVLLFWWTQFEMLRDDTFKWLWVPDEEFRQNLDLSRIADELYAAEKRGDGGMFTQALPAIQATIHARIRHQRETNLLRVVEALRMYAAENGRWPEKLDDITEVPVPNDPWSQKPFEYAVKDGVALLQAPSTPKAPWPITQDQRYELTLRDNGKPKDGSKQEK